MKRQFADLFIGIVSAFVILLLCNFIVKPPLTSVFLFGVLIIVLSVILFLIFKNQSSIRRLSKITVISGATISLYILSVVSTILSR